jgi:hypothetical protein
MDDRLMRPERTERPVWGGDPDAGGIAIPPVEDLFDVGADPTDFMSVQSFPASDPPSHSPEAAPRETRKDVQVQTE